MTDAGFEPEGFGGGGYQSERQEDPGGYPEGYVLQGEGSMDQMEENETAVLFGRLGDELQMLVQRYCVPPTELEELFQVSAFGQWFS